MILLGSGNTRWIGSLGAAAMGAWVLDNTNKLDLYIYIVSGFSYIYRFWMLDIVFYIPCHSNKFILCLLPACCICLGAWPGSASNSACLYGCTCVTYRLPALGLYIGCHIWVCLIYTYEQIRYIYLYII